MKLIISELEERSKYTSREAAYIIRELINRHGWNQIETEYLRHSSGTLKSLLLTKFERLPDVILSWEGYYLFCARKSEFEALSCSKYILCDDLHDGEEHTKQDKLTAFPMFDTILSTYGYLFDYFFPDLVQQSRVVWVPHSASPDFLVTYNEHPENAIFLSGVVNDFYPLRLRMKALSERGAYPIVIHRHPGYRCDFEYETNDCVGRGYARRISNYRTAFTDSSKYKYAVAKYFEIPATGGLLLADRAISEPLKALGFIEDTHYIGVSDEDLEEKIEYVLDDSNHDELDKVRRKGQELVWRKHTTRDRARLIDEICTAADHLDSSVTFNAWPWYPMP